jgi:hypothetical protein
MASRYTAGERLVDIARDFGIAESTVASAVRAHGGTVRKRGFGSSPEKFTGAGNPAWKTGRHVNDHGYWRVLLDRNDPLYSMARRGYVLEHRLVMARLINRPLTPDETVHHIDGDKLNNDPSNLQLRQGRHGRGSHWRCGDCGSHNVVAQEL